jgi:hypothetical protein
LSTRPERSRRRGGPKAVVSGEKPFETCRRTREVAARLGVRSAPARTTPLGGRNHDNCKIPHFTEPLAPSISSAREGRACRRGVRWWVRHATRRIVHPSTQPRPGCRQEAHRVPDLSDRGGRSTRPLSVHSLDRAPERPERMDASISRLPIPCPSEGTETVGICRILA